VAKLESGQLHRSRSHLHIGSQVDVLVKFKFRVRCPVTQPLSVLELFLELGVQPDTLFGCLECLLDL